MTKPPTCQSLLVLGLLFAGGCACRKTSPHTPGPTQNHANRADTLLQVDQAFSRCSIEHGAATAFATFAAPDAVLLPSGLAPVHGPEAIRTVLSEPPAGRLTWNPAYADLSTSGDLGFTYGFYEFRPAEGPKAGQVIRGKYVTIWRLQPDGSWKYVLDAGNQGPP